MLNLFNNVISSTAVAITPAAFLACTAVSVALGFVIAFAHSRGERCSQSFLVALILLPAIVQMVIMLVNGNIGAGVAVAGAFSLIRFRSIPGTAKDIGSIFLAMAAGLATGMGYLGLAVVFTGILCALMLLLTALRVGESKHTEKELKITIPESLDYSEIFEDLFAEYTQRAELVNVRTTNMGSLYRLHYQIELKNAHREKEFIDKLRCRNGNLEISCGRIATMERL